MLGDRALPGLEQRFKNLQPASSQNFLGLVFANSVLDQSARHVSRVGMIGHLPAEEPDNETEKILRESWLQILEALL